MLLILIRGAQWCELVLDVCNSFASDRETVFGRLIFLALKSMDLDFELKLASLKFVDLLGRCLSSDAYAAKIQSAKY